MAEYYLDQGAYSSALGTTPTWGIPQEGDGSAQAAAAASAIASLAFSAVPTTGVFTCCGVTVSTTGVLNAATVLAAADTLAANINAATAAVGSAVAYGIPQLRNLVYARGPTLGAPAGTVQIMMRAGSDTLNYATNTNAAIASTFTGTPTVVQFAGGSGGCWGWWMNPTAIGVSNSYAGLSYGLFINKPLVSVSAFSEFDNINVRTGRNLTINAGTGSWGAALARATFVNFVFDDGTVWTGDSPTAKMTILWEAYGAAVTWSELSQFSTYRCRKLGGLTISLRHTSGYGLSIGNVGTSGASLGFVMEKVAFVEIVGGNATQNYYILTSTYPNSYEVSFIGCLFDFSAVPRTSLLVPLITANMQNPSSISFIGNKFKYSLTGVGGAAIAIPFMKSAAAALPLGVIMRGNVFETGTTDDLVAYSLEGLSAAVGFSLILENNKGIGLPKGALGLNPSRRNQDTALVFVDQLAVGGAAKYETRAGYCEFNAGQPVLSSVSPDGTLWSWLAYWTNSAGAITPGRPFKMPASRQQSRLATGVRAWSMELLLDAVAMAQMPTFGVVEVEYVTTGGLPVCDRFPVTLSASSAAWTNTVAAPFNTWVAQSVSGVTTQPVPINSILSIRLLLERSLAGGSTAAFAVNPEVALS